MNFIWKLFTGRNFFLVLIAFLVPVFFCDRSFPQSSTHSQILKRAIPVCSVCGKNIVNRYSIVRNEKFCSEKCLAERYSCANCGVTLGTSENPGFSTIRDIKEREIFFCSRCTKEAGCSFCASRKKTTSLRDGRLICSTCRELAIFTTEDARPILKAAQGMLEKEFGFPKNPDIPLKVLPKSEFLQEAKNALVTTEALALHQTNVTGQFFLSEDGRELQIDLKELDSGMLILEGAPAPMAFDSIVHELTHEFLCRKFYHFEDAKIEEGFCESMAAACSILNGHPSLAERRISNQDPIYGDGFRLIYSMLQEKGWDETMSFLRKNSISIEEYFREHPEEFLDQETMEYLKKHKLKPEIKFGSIQN